MAEQLINFASGVLTADPGSGGTTLNSANFAFVPAVAIPNTMRLTLDPDGLSGAPEIVLVTAHTASATSLTVTRGQETTFGGGAARAHAVDTVWRHSLTHGSLYEIMVPAGTIHATIGTTADPGYVLIDGSTVTGAQTLYPATWARIPAAWKSGANMVLPDWRAHMLVMDDATFTLGGSGGSNTHAITQAELPAVAPTITITDPQHTHPANAVADSATAGATNKMLYRATDSIAGGTPITGSSATGITAASSNLGSGTAMSLLSAYGVVNFQLKVH